VWPQAVEAATGGDGSGLLAAVATLAGLVVTGLVTIVVALINRSKPTAPAPPSTDPALAVEPDIKIRERMHTVEYRLDDHDAASEIQDRRLDQLERALDIDNPRWRHR
jgi:hypothetical protein